MGKGFSINLGRFELKLPSCVLVGGNKESGKNRLMRLINKEIYDNYLVSMINVYSFSMVSGEVKFNLPNMYAINVSSEEEFIKEFKSIIGKPVAKISVVVIFDCVPRNRENMHTYINTMNFLKEKGYTIIQVLSENGVDVMGYNFYNYRICTSPRDNSVLVSTIKHQIKSYNGNGKYLVFKDGVDFEYTPDYTDLNYSVNSIVDKHLVNYLKYKEYAAGLPITNCEIPWLHGILLHNNCRILSMCGRSGRSNAMRSTSYHVADYAYRNDIDIHAIYMDSANPGVLAACAKNNMYMKTISVVEDINPLCTLINSIANRQMKEGRKAVIFIDNIPKIKHSSFVKVREVIEAVSDSADMYFILGFENVTEEMARWVEYNKSYILFKGSYAGSYFSVSMNKLSELEMGSGLLSLDNSVVHFPYMSGEEYNELCEKFVSERERVNWTGNVQAQLAKVSFDKIDVSTWTLTSNGNKVTLFTGDTIEVKWDFMNSADIVTIGLIKSITQGIIKVEVSNKDKVNITEIPISSVKSIEVSKRNPDLILK